MSNASKPQWIVMSVLVGVLVLASGAVHAQAPGQAQRQEPTPYELELWRAAAWLNEIKAYEAYLAEFPKGTFAEIARLSLRRLASGDSAASGAAATTTPPKAWANPDGLQALRGRALETGALNIRPGNRLIGPGVVTIGWFGAKRQMVVPPGEWIVITAYDHLLAGLAMLQMTTLAIAQFEASGLKSLIVATLNSRSPPVSPPTGGAAGTALATAVSRWPASEECEAVAESALVHRVESSYRLQKCSAIRRVGTQDAMAFAPNLKDRVNLALQALHVEMPQFILRTEVHLTGSNREYFGYVRLDAAGNSHAGSGGASADVQALVDRRKAWLANLIPLLEQGNARKLNVDDLEPERPPGGVWIDLRD